MLTITKEFLFDAAHKLQLSSLSQEENEKLYGRCSQFHGHTYRLQVSVSGAVGPGGMLMNFGHLKQIVQDTVISRYDHAYLNDLEEYRDVPVTAENMAQHMFRVLDNLLDAQEVRLQSVRLYETPTSWATKSRER